MAHMTDTSYSADTPLSLFRVVQILGRRKWFILAMVLIFTLTAYFLSSLAPKRYDLTSVLEIGLYPSGQQAKFDGLVLTGALEFAPIEKGYDVKARYQALARGLARESEFEEAPFVVKRDFEVEIMSQTMVSPVLTTEKVDLALDFMARLNQSVLADHRRLFATFWPDQGRDGKFPEKIKKSFPIPLTNKDLLGSISSNLVENQLQPRNGGPAALVLYSRILEEPVYEQEAVSPRPLRNSVLAGVIALVLAVVSCFLIEGWQSYKKWVAFEEK